MINRIIFLLVFCLSVSFAEDAMFGLQWGMSPTALKAQVNLTKLSTDNNLSMYECDSLPKNFSMAYKYFLIFDEDSLVKIEMKTFKIKNDPYGLEGKEQFDRIFSLLKAKYPVEKTYCNVGDKLYKESDEFYQCLAYPGCGFWIAFLKDSTKSIVLKLEGLGRGCGFIFLSVENRGLDIALEKFKRKKSIKDSESF